ncbi:hypothetical protein E4198_06970 [Streptomyces sp. RKND-216]|uniref:Uncharacterized protein n=1 Tax=Streptomyces hazeniae TaxID=3075538 RepID=A0ABU2NMF6_9ACTN|nr:MULTISPECIES: hypothetical protein [unclassified Streptomyces]MDT0378161.1 hypothetical protein [Streptomyces sp. DSM 42041]THA24521.1 hypothetical protein E4198_06970 [Streptomyces sp. RKND-216]
MASHSTFSAKAHKARSLVENTLRQARTRGHGRTTAAPRGGRSRTSTAADVRRVALRAREAFRK